MKYIKICLKCKSFNIALRWKSLWFLGFPASHQCKDCGYIGRMFPEVDINKIKIYNIMATEAYCVKCKAKRMMKDEKEVSMNGKGGKKRAAMTGICEKCGTKMFRIMGLKK